MRTIRTCGFVLLMAALPMCAKAKEPVTAKANDETWTGTVTTVNDQSRTLTGKDWMFSKTFYLGDHCTIATLDNHKAALNALRPGEKVKVQYRNAEGVLVAERIAERPLHYTGTVQRINQTGNQLTMEEKPLYKPFHAPDSFRVASDCKVILWNGHEGTLADLRPGDRISLLYELPSGSRVAYRIKDHDQAVVGEVEAINLPARTLTAKEPSGEKNFALGDHCRIIIAGKKPGELKNLVAGQEYRFTYEEVNGVNVLDRIAPAPKENTAQTASTM
jgi:Domain of unknown function (DUF5666)